MPDPIYPTYAVGDTDSDNEITRVVAVSSLKSDQNQLTDLLRRVISEHPATNPEISDMAKLLQQLGRGALNRPTAAVKPPVPTTLEQPSRQRLSPKQRPLWRDLSDVMYFSCGRMGHAATRCPDFDDSFPFLQPGWQKEKMPGGFIMIPPRGQWIAGGRKTATDPRGRACLSGQGSRSAPGPRWGSGIDCFPTTDEN